MSQPSDWTYTAGALRAANAIFDVQPGGREPAAEIIDRETGLADLLTAAKTLIHSLPDGEYAGLGKLRIAIRNAENPYSGSLTANSPPYAPVGHVVGQGGKCWCGELHADYIEVAR